MLIFRVILAIGLAVGSMFAMSEMFQSVPAEKAELLQTGADKEYCPNCGMYLPKFYKTNHAAQLDDGKVIQYCSLYCLVEQFEITEFRGQKDRLKQVMVVDVPSLKFIDAKTAYYVVDSKKPATMGIMSEYAFAHKEDAEKFLKENGGTIMNYEDAYKNAVKNFAKDTAYVYKKRSEKMYGKGKEIYEKKCNQAKMESLDVHTMGMLKEAIKSEKVCGDGLDDTQLQAVMLYFWDKRLDKFNKLYGESEEVQKEIKNMGLDK